MSNADDRAERDGSDDELLTRLFRSARPRARAPEEHERELRAALHGEWDQIAGQRVRTRRNRRLAAAAAVVAVIAGTMFLSQWSSVPEEAATVARIEKLDGDVRVSRSDDDARVLSVVEGLQLRENYRITTEAGQLAVALEGGGLLRLATDTVLELTSSNEVELIRGALYFDSQPARESSDTFVVQTSAGVVRHLGTQYIARETGQSLEISVREGVVELSGDDRRSSVSAGEMLEAGTGGREIGRQAIALYGDRWRWADRMAPSFAIDGKSLLDFLAWAARETGYSLQFESDDVERVAQLTVLHGRIDMDPLAMLSAVLSTTELRHDISDGVLRISQR